jgi:antitoxin (DNA-binding transcriptional repressor) of toxin-antitoxin stability system
MTKRVIRVSDEEAANDFAALLDCVRKGAEVLIENGTHSIPVVLATPFARRKITECIALLPLESDAVIDADFAKDVDAAIGSHREPLTPPAWD